MSYTVFTSNPAALIAQPGRAVNTFPSGLVCVDQTYLGLTSHGATHRAILAVGNDMPDGDSSPCIDGLKIFPEVQERCREDGFTEYKVSAFGRVNNTGKISRGFSVQKYQENFSISEGENLPPLQYSVTEFWEIETLTYSLTIPASSAMDSLPAVPAPLFKRLRRRRVTGNRPGNVTSQLSLDWFVVPTQIQRKNYGHIDELIMTYGYE